MEQTDTIAFTVNDAVKASGLTRTRLYVLLGENAIQAVRVGRRTLIKADSLRNYVNSQTPATFRRRGRA